MEILIVRTEEFNSVKNDYKILFSSVEKLNKKLKAYLLIDYNGKCVIIYHLKKLEKGYEKLSSASFFCKNVSDSFYKKNYENGKTQIERSLIEMIASRLNLPK